MKFVPLLIAVDTEDDAEAREAARVVAENTSGESFRLLEFPQNIAPASPGEERGGISFRAPDLVQI